ncbi:MAG: hypothetical protein M5U26_14100 [Planctomycetota bacterium]|nr:hypothetical protein [Planctomycetota bacterium]
MKSTCSAPSQVHVAPPSALMAGPRTPMQLLPVNVSFTVRPAASRIRPYQ